MFGEKSDQYCEFAPEFDELSRCSWKSGGISSLLSIVVHVLIIMQMIPVLSFAEEFLGLSDQRHLTRRMTSR
jgi:hypothetical protein